MDLGGTLIQSVKIGRFNYLMSIICLGELKSMMRQKLITPLMLKKNPEVVKWIAKLCRFTDENRSARGEASISAHSQQIRIASKSLLNMMKVLMDFDGPNDVFMEYFSDHVKLFTELTTNLTDTEKRQLTIDPELDLMNDINDA